MKITLTSTPDFKVQIPLNLLPKLVIETKKYISDESCAEIEMLKKLLQLASQAVMIENQLIVIDDEIAKLPPILTEYYQITRVSPEMNIVVISFQSFLLTFKVKTYAYSLGRSYEISREDFSKIYQLILAGKKITAVTTLRKITNCRLLSAKYLVELIGGHLLTFSYSWPDFTVENSAVKILVQKDKVTLTAYLSVEFSNKN